MKGNFEKLKKELKEKNVKAYEEAREIILFLSQERIKLIGNGIRQNVGRTSKNIDKQKIIEAINKLNSLAKENEVDFNISDNWEYIEKYLKFTITEDIGKEITKQNK